MLNIRDRLIQLLLVVVLFGGWELGGDRRSD